MRSDAVKNVVALLKNDPQVSDYKINVTKKDSFEMFFVKGKLETVRATDTCDRKVTVYVDHDGFRGDASFYLYPSTTQAQMAEKVSEAVVSAKLICNAPYTLPAAETGAYTIASNLNEEPLPVLADKIAEAVFGANTQKDGSLNAVEVFLNHYTESVSNSRGLDKTQSRCDAMVEAIPTFNGDRESVELYEQYNFSALSLEALTEEIAGKMTAVKARYEAEKPSFKMDGPVVLHKQELSDLFSAIAGDLNYSTVYGHSNLLHKGDKLQKNCTGDPITVTMKGEVRGNIASAHFDGDGMSLTEITLVEEGTVKNYYGANRFGQYLDEKPTGSLGCLCVAPGTAQPIEGRPWLEVISMSGLQVDFFNDYIGGEIRLAYYHDGEKTLPVTGLSISGKLQEILDRVKLSANTDTFDGYMGPATAVCEGFKIF